VLSIALLAIIKISLIQNVYHVYLNANHVILVHLVYHVNQAAYLMVNAHKIVQINNFTNKYLWLINALAFVVFIPVILVKPFRVALVVLMVTYIIIRA